MATITTKITTEYFSQMNLRNATPAFMYLDELTISNRVLNCPCFLGHIVNSIFHPVNRTFELIWCVERVM